MTIQEMNRATQLYKALYGHLPSLSEIKKIIKQKNEQQQPEPESTPTNLF